jgi:thiamine pyrophosphokinase
MKQALIIANGRVEKPAELSSYTDDSTLIIAANGGIHNCTSLGIQPNIIIGDLDSMEFDEISSYREAGVEVIQFPSHKDETDLELALQYAEKHKIRDVIIIGGLGARWDMTITNILLIANPMFNRMNIRLLEGTQELFLLHPDKYTVVHGQPGDTVSLIPLTSDVFGVVTDGLEYPLNDETLKFGASRGVSNVLLKKQAMIYFKHGLLLCTLSRTGK